jgi:hypothetical protein
MFHAGSEICALQDGTRLIPPAGLFNDSSEGRSKVATPKAFSLEPMLCEGAERPPEGPEWRY